MKPIKIETLKLVSYEIPFENSQYDKDLLEIADVKLADEVERL
jgi:hypothetical protein